MYDIEFRHKYYFIKRFMYHLFHLRETRFVRNKFGIRTIPMYSNLRIYILFSTRRT